MARVIFSEDDEICASCATISVAKAEVVKAYFAEKVISNSVASKSNSKITAAKKYTVAKGQGWWRVAQNTGKTKAELLKLNNLKNDYVLQTDDVLITEAASTTSTTDSSDSGGKKLTFKKIDQSTMATTVYVIVETKNLHKKDISLELRQAGAKVVVDKDSALTVVNQKKAVTSMKSDVGELATGKYSNDEELKNLAVFKIRLDPDDEKKHKNWVDAINKASDKKTKLYLQVDAHTPNELKSNTIDYQGLAAGETKEKSAFLSESGKEFSLDINFAMHIYHTGEISKINLKNLKKVKMIYHDSKDKLHELCECDVLQVDKRANGKQWDKVLDPKTKKKVKVKVKLPSDTPESTASYTGVGVSAKNSYYYKNGDVYSKGRKYGKDGHIIRYKKAGGKTFLLKMADPLSYSKDGVTAKYTWHQTKRRYCGPYEYAGFLGALAQFGKTVKCGGSSYKDSTAFPSLEHCNGEAVDTNYLSSKTDQQKFVTAMNKFGFSDQIISSERKHTHARNESKKATLHNSHMHSGKFKAKFKT